MIRQRVFEVEDWAVRESRLDLDVLAQSESVFALSNGHIGIRGNLDEGEPHGLPGTYLNGLYEARPLPYAEAGYGYPESGETVVNVTNGKLIRLLVGDALFDIRYGELRSHDRVLDLRAGTLEREVEWVTPTGQPVRIRSTRFVSFAQRAIAAISYEVEPLEGTARVVLQSELVANEPIAGRRRRSPLGRGRVAARARVRRLPTTSTPSSSTGRRRAACAWRRGWSTGSTGRTGRRRRPRRATTSRARR